MFPSLMIPYWSLVTFQSFTLHLSCLTAIVWHRCRARVSLPALPLLPWLLALAWHLLMLRSTRRQTHAPIHLRTHTFTLAPAQKSLDRFLMLLGVLQHLTHSLRHFMRSCMQADAQPYNTTKQSSCMQCEQSLPLPLYESTQEKTAKKIVHISDDCSHECVSLVLLLGFVVWFML